MTCRGARDQQLIRRLLVRWELRLSRRLAALSLALLLWQCRRPISGGRRQLLGRRMALEAHDQSTNRDAIDHGVAVVERAQVATAHQAHHARSALEHRVRFVDRRPAEETLRSSDDWLGARGLSTRRGSDRSLERCDQAPNVQQRRKVRVDAVRLEQRRNVGYQDAYSLNALAILDAIEQHRVVGIEEQQCADRLVVRVAPLYWSIELFGRHDGCCDRRRWSCSWRCCSCCCCSGITTNDCDWCWSSCR